MVDTSLITSAVITGGISTAAFASGAGLPVGIALGITSLASSLGTPITRKTSKTLTVKQEKHNFIKLLAQSRLDSIANIISQAMQDGDISPTEEKKKKKEKKKRCRRFFTKNYKYFRYSGCQCHLSPSTLGHAILWSIKDYKNQPLKLVFPVCGINFRIQHLTCVFIRHRVTIYHDISLKPLPCKLPHHILHHLLIIYFFINDLLFSNFLYACHTGGGI